MVRCVVGVSYHKVLCIDCEYYRSPIDVYNSKTYAGVMCAITLKNNSWITTANWLKPDKVIASCLAKPK